jgi:hypothetical protein
MHCDVVILNCHLFRCLYITTDLALVLRDQRRLNDWIMACKARHAIPKSLIKRFPRVPFQPWSSCEGENSVFVPSITDEDEKSWECKKAPPGMFKQLNFSELVEHSFHVQLMEILHVKIHNQGPVGNLQLLCMSYVCICV